MSNWGESVFPPLLRAGFAGITEFNSNYHLICRGLRTRYLEECVRHGNYVDVSDPKLWEVINAIDLENISDIFPFEEEEAQDKLRMLK